MKLLRYLVNTILFVIFFWLQLFIVIGYSIAEVGVRPSGPIAVGGIIALLISYALVKKINKSNLWSSLFDENQIVEKKNETKKDIKKYKKSKLSNLANDLTKLGELKEKGLLTEEEFLEQKRNIL